MLPGWIEKLLESAGMLGAIIFVLLMTIAALVAHIKQLNAKADKVYGFRLEERDSLLKGLAEAAEVIRGIVATTKERNDLTKEQADLLDAQIHAFDLLKASILSQYDGIKDISHATSAAVTAMADSVRTLAAQVSENKYAFSLMITELRQQISEAHHETQEKIAVQAQRAIDETKANLAKQPARRQRQ